MVMVTIEEFLGKWMEVIDPKLLRSTMSKLDVEYSKNIIFPSRGKVFKAFRLCPYEDLKVVMLSQDPYPQPNVATGLLFANNKEVSERDLSPSLKIIKEAAINFEVPHNSIIFDQTLESWAKQGILLINTALTVEENKIGSHVSIWEPFMRALISNLSKRKTGIVYVLFGKQAENYRYLIDSRYNYIIREYHPAYYARMGSKMPSRVFEEIRKIVEQVYKVNIKWYE